MDALSPPSTDPEFLLHLFVAGAAPNSLRAVRNAKEICEHYLPGRYVLNITDIHQQPSLVGEQQVLAVPLLVRLLPLPRRQVFGDLADRAKVREVLGLPVPE